MAAGGVTALLIDWSNGDRGALDQMMPLVYQELRGIARRHLGMENHPHTLAVEKYREAERIRAALAAADPRDARAAASVVSVRWRLGIAMTHAGDREGALRAFQASAAEGERMMAALPDPKRESKL